MSFIVTATGAKHDVQVEHTIYAEARDANMGVAHFINNKYKDSNPDLKIGTPFQQICASVGLLETHNRASFRPKESIKY